MRILVIGGSGYVGSWIVDCLRRSGHSVYILSRSESNEFSFKADVTDVSSLKLVFENNFDTVIYAVGFSDQSPDNYYSSLLKVNVNGLRNVLECIKAKDIRHFIYISSFHVYGKTSGEIDESCALNPASDYGLAHSFCEQYVRQFHQQHGLNYEILRLTNGYGCPISCESGNWTLLINDLSKQAFVNESIVIKSNPNQLRDFIWLGSLCRVILEILNLKDSLNDVFNVSSGKAYSLKSVAEVVQQTYKEYSGKIIPITYLSHIEDQKTKLFVSPNKIRSIINYEISDKMSLEVKDIFNLLRKDKS